MPPVAVESGFVSRIVSHREVMISIGCLMLVLLTLLLGRGSAAVLLLNTKNESRSFPDMEAAFGTFCNSLQLSPSLSPSYHHHHLVLKYTQHSNDVDTCI